MQDDKVLIDTLSVPMQAVLFVEIVAETVAVTSALFAWWGVVYETLNYYLPIA